MLKSDIINIINQIEKKDINIETLSAIIKKKDFKNKYGQQKRAVLYRNIGEDELRKLLEGQLIKGGYNLSREPQSSANYKNVICTFTEKILWKRPNSDYYQYLVTLEVPSELLTQMGYGTYYASKEFETTKIWTGHRGKTKYEIPEVYLNNYNIGNLVHVEKTTNSAYPRDIMLKLEDLEIPFS